MIWFPFYASDFIGATIGLSCQEVSIYNWMLTLYYELGPFPADPVRVYRIVRCESDEQKRTVDYLLQTFFVFREDGWYQPRAEEEKAKDAQRHEEARTRGKRSAEVRLSKYGTAQPVSRKAFETLSKASGNASELPTPTPTPIKEKDKDAADAADVWAYGIELLTKESGLSDRQARSYLGILCKQWPEQAVLDALMAATGKADPKAFARKFLEDKPRKGQRRRSAAQELIDEMGGSE